MNHPELNESLVLDTLRQVIDPELGCNIVDLGLIYDVKLDGENVRVAMTVTSPGCPMQESMRWGVFHTRRREFEPGYHQPIIFFP